MSPLFWLLRTLGGMVGLGGVPWEEARDKRGQQSLGRGEGERSEPSRPHSS